MYWVRFEHMETQSQRKNERNIQKLQKSEIKLIRHNLHGRCLNPIDENIDGSSEKRV
jgi:hypothetical protein